MIQKRDILFNLYNKYIPFLLFFMISCGLWFLNKMGKTYVKEINYPVEYSYQSNKYTISSNLPEYLTIKVRTEGYRLLKYQIQKNILPVNININDLPVRSLRKQGINRYFFKTEYVEYLFTSALNEEIILDIMPDTIFFKLSPIASKRVEIRANGEIETAKQHIFKNKTIITPDSITIQGPKYLIDSIKFVNTTLFHIKNLKDKKSINTELIEINNIDYSQNNVNIYSEAERYTEHTMSIDIKTINTPENISIKLFPSKVELNFHIGLSNFKNIKPSDFEIGVIYDSLINTSNKEATIQIIKQPHYIKSLRLNRNTAEYLIEKND